MSKDRIDGKYICPNDAVHLIMPYIMDKRTEAEVSAYSTLDITNLVKWVDKKNETLDYKMTYFHALTMVFAKVLYNRPNLNRFIQGNRMYMRKFVSLGFVAKDKFSDEAEEKMIVLKVNPKETGPELSRREAIDIFKTRSAGTNGMDKFLKTITKAPRWLMKIILRIFRWMDYHGYIPESLINSDFGYTSILLSNLGSIKCDSCYHHLNNYGTNSIVITIGTIKSTKTKQTVEIASTIDERIADGFYFAKSIKLANYICEHPELLEEELESKVDFDF